MTSAPAEEGRLKAAPFLRRPIRDILAPKSLAPEYPPKNAQPRKSQLRNARL